MDVVDDAMREIRGTSDYEYGVAIEKARNVRN